MNYENDIKTMLMDLGVDPALNGFGYLVEAVKIKIDCWKNKKQLNTIPMYEKVAEIYGTTKSKVERSIRHAVEKAFLINNNWINLLFEDMLKYNDKVANSTFIAVIAEKIIMNEN